MDFLASNHPRIVHFAIAFLFVYPLLEIIGVLFKREFFSKTAHLVLLIGVLAAIGAVLTGNQAEMAFDYWNKESSALMENHEYYANLTLWYFGALLVLRTFFVIKKKFTGMFRYMFIVLALVGAFFVFKTGDQGGKMVFKHGVGTEYKTKIMEQE